MQYQISGYGVRLDDFLNDHKIINKFSEARDYLVAFVDTLAPKDAPCTIIWDSIKDEYSNQSRHIYLYIADQSLVQVDPKKYHFYTENEAQLILMDCFREMISNLDKATGTTIDGEEIYFTIDKPDGHYYCDFIYQFARYLEQHAEHFSATITNENM